MIFHREEFWVGREQFVKDLVAGVTVGIVALPLAIGFGITSGMSAQAGISTAILAGFIAALFGGSRYQVSGPTGAMTVVLIPVIAKNGIEAIPVLGLMAGVIVIAMSLLRLGGIINRIPWAVVEGFTLGIAVVIALQQLPMALGVVKGEGDHTLQVAINTVNGAIENGVHTSTIAILVLTLFIKFNIVKIIERLKLKPYVPASFSALAITTLIVAIFNLDVAKIGEIPRNVFIWKGSGLHYSSSLITPAILIALLAAIESLLAARVADGMTHEKNKFHPNKELFGQGLATMVASIFGGQPATGAEQHPAPQLAIPGAKGGAGLQQARQQPEPGQGTLITRQRQRTGQQQQRRAAGVHRGRPQGIQHAAQCRPANHRRLDTRGTQGDGALQQSLRHQQGSQRLLGRHLEGARQAQQH
jgi:SulP family sulfate permease